MIDVVAAIIERNGEVLLAQRNSSSDQAGLWEFPGGKVEAGETQPQALVRELAEELNIAATVAGYIATNQWDSGKKSSDYMPGILKTSAASHYCIATQPLFGCCQKRLITILWHPLIFRY